MKRSHYVSWIFFIAFLTLFIFYVVEDGVAGDFESPMGVEKNYKIFYEREKAEFLQTVWETFQSASPQSEGWDSEYTRLENVGFYTELTKHYAHFDAQLKRIVPNGCPLKKVDVPSRYMNGEDRSFLIFDIKNCKPKKGE